MAHWWFHFADRKPGCVALECSLQDAMEVAKEFGHVKEAWVLPYPAAPRLDNKDGWGSGQHPSFCHDPEHCKGRTACPKERACDD